MSVTVAISDRPHPSWRPEDSLADYRILGGWGSWEKHIHAAQRILRSEGVPWQAVTAAMQAARYQWKPQYGGSGGNGHGIGRHMLSDMREFLARGDDAIRAYLQEEVDAGMLTAAYYFRADNDEAWDGWVNTDQ